MRICPACWQNVAGAAKTLQFEFCGSLFRLGLVWVYKITPVNTCNISAEIKGLLWEIELEQRTKATDFKEIYQALKGKLAYMLESDDGKCISQHCALQAVDFQLILTPKG